MSRQGDRNAVGPGARKEAVTEARTGARGEAAAKAGVEAGAEAPTGEAHEEDGPGRLTKISTFSRRGDRKVIGPN